MLGLAAALAAILLAGGVATLVSRRRRQSWISVTGKIADVACYEQRGEWVCLVGYRYAAGEKPCLGEFRRYFRSEKQAAEYGQRFQPDASITVRIDPEHPQRSRADIPA